MAEVPEPLRAALAGWYTFDRELGRGGMATVYLARDLRYGRPVAVKVLHPERTEALGRERFLREIDIAARLNHPHILPLLDSGEASGFLYYVMPHVEGESLKQRLDREKQLPLSDALAIAGQVALALHFAHEHGVVHRDVKPGNILLAGGQAIVADFGIARAVRRAAVDEDRLTETGTTLGTPAYVSPEQAGGEAELDGRSDVYALGCVLYEMLAGAPPFTGTSSQAILARHMLDPVPSIRTVRPTVPEGIEGVVRRALEKVPADRYQTAAEFAAALAAPGERRRGEGRGRWRPRRKTLLSVVGGAAALVLVWVITGGPVGGSGVDLAALDTSRYAILPFEREAGVAPFNEEQLLQDALGRWTGTSVVDPFQVKDAIVQRGSRPLRPRDAWDVAAKLGAGRYVRGEVSRIGDSIRVYVGLYDAMRRGTLLRDTTARLGSGFAGAAREFAALGDRLLFGDEGPGVRAEARVGTTSVPARQAFARGQAAIQEWDLEAADSAFAAAARWDAEYAQAFLWLAQVRSWMTPVRLWGDSPTAVWHSAAEQAGAGRDRLSSRDRQLSDALLALARGEVERACRVWSQLTDIDPHDFAGWYGLGNCLGRDDAVVRDGTSPSGWRFRSSYHRATNAYERAFGLLPSIHRSLRGGSFASVRRLLMTSGNAVRPGRALLPDTTTFAAYPVWQGDTLAFVPYPRAEILSKPWARSDAANVAVRKQRERFHQITTAWATAFPGSSEALEALAISMEMLGDPAARDILRRARSLARTVDERLRVAGSEVWMQVRLSVPSNPPGVRAARALADSLLESPTAAGADPLLLASLATLTGRARLAAAYCRHPAAARAWRVPGPLAQTAFPLLAFAALGGPPDSLRVLEQQVDSLIENALPVPLRREARLAWLARPAALAFPDYRFASIPRLAGMGDYLVDIEAALLRDDRRVVWRRLGDLRLARRSVPPATLTFEGLYPEAWMLSALGDPQAAITWLEPTLSVISGTVPQVATDPAEGGALVRAMALRADLAERVGDRATARQWARTVEILWSDADAFLQPVVRRMASLAR